MDTVTATRTDLLARRRAAGLAEQGRDVLADKRTALMRSFQERNRELLRRLAAMQGSAAAARSRLDEAGAAIGPAALASAAMAVVPDLGVRVDSEVVAGVVVIDLGHASVRRDPAERGYAALAVDPAVDDVADVYERETLDLLELAALELTVRRLAQEIARTTQQVNALEHVIVPRLRAEERWISLALEEREREETARLRRARSAVVEAPPTVGGTDAETTL
ncbi:MAG: V-type ATP synthase subunit D [Nocardioides sp.]